MVARNSERIPMTPGGYQQLKEELHRLKSVERPKVIQEIAESMGHGDLSENAEYHAAKEKQSFVEGKIQEVEDKLALAEVIDISTLSGDRVVFGATVTLMDTDTGEKFAYQIVGDTESDFKDGKISLSSPIARALIGKIEGDEVRVQTPNGVRVLEILKVEFRP
jgi:transcription elongation factor GreA